MSQAVLKQENAKPVLFLVDGSGFIFRAYHSLPPLTNPEGTPVGAVYGFTNMLMKLKTSMNAAYISVVFDTARKNFRNDIYPEYKAHRPPPPEDLIPQFPLVRDATRAMNIKCLEMEGFEADDIIATLAVKAVSEGYEVVIVSSDKDLMQLIGNGVRMYDPIRSKYVGAEEVKEKFGVGPDKVVEVLALAGDSSDNVPGVPGIGVKTAAELINRFGSLEELYNKTSEITQVKRRQTLEENREKAFLSEKLVILRKDVPISVGMLELEYKGADSSVLQAFLEKHGFRSLSVRVGGKESIRHSGSPLTQISDLGSKQSYPESSEQPASLDSRLRGNDSPYGNYHTIKTVVELQKWVEKATRAGKVAVDTETTDICAMDAQLVGVSLGLSGGQACYIPVGHVQQEKQASLLEDSSKKLEGQMDILDAFKILKPLLEDDSVLKIGHNIKYDKLVLKKYGVEITSYDDTMLMSYSLDTGRNGHGMDELSELHLGKKPITYDEVTGTGKNRINFSEVDIAKATEYAAEDADITYRLHEFFGQRIITEHATTLYQTVERPLVEVVTNMEEKGVLVDVVRLRNLSTYFAKRIGELEKEIYAIAGSEFNVGSPKQLGEILFDKLQLPGGKKGKTGAYETGAGVLEDLAGAGHEIAAKALEWRQHSKLKSTYTDALEKEINRKTGRVHTSYSLAATSTGRLSSNEPNLQNIPIRTEDGRKIREAFVAPSGCKLISADYSQIELRLLAHIAGIETLKNAFREKKDIHAITASEMFGVPVDKVDAELRRRAKTINFGIIYGISSFGLASRLGIPNREAANYIEAYFAKYPGIKEYMETTREFARKHGYVETLYGRKCYMRGINDKNHAVRSFAERAAINAPLQGTAADIIKRAMISVYKELKTNLPDCSMLLQVHDELVFEVKDSEVEKASAIIKKCMEGAASLSVPMTVEVRAGQTWGEAH